MDPKVLEYLSLGDGVIIILGTAAIIKIYHSMNKKVSKDDCTRIEEGVRNSLSEMKADIRMLIDHSIPKAYQEEWKGRNKRGNKDE